MHLISNQFSVLIHNNATLTISYIQHQRIDKRLKYLAGLELRNEMAWLSECICFAYKLTQASKSVVLQTAGVYFN
jgi:hypothetical protein